MLSSPLPGIVGAAEKAEVKTGLTTLAAPGYAGAQLSAAAEIKKANVQQKPIPKKEKHTSSNLNRGAGCKHHIQQPARRGQN